MCTSVVFNVCAMNTKVDCFRVRIKHGFLTYGETLSDTNVRVSPSGGVSVGIRKYGGH